MTDAIGEVKTFGNPPIQVKDVVDDAGNTYCQVHTNVETALRCNNCGRLMCANCAIQTPVGYRCRECIRANEDRFFNASNLDYAKIFGITAALGAVGAFIAMFVGFFLFIFFIAAALGGAIAEAAMRVTKGSRGRYSGHVAAAGIVIGTVIAFSLRTGILPISPLFFRFLFANISLLLYAGITAFIVFGRFNIFGRRR